MQEEESKIIWQRFLLGDKDAYCRLYNEYVQLLYRFGLRFTSDGEVIKDCIQDVFMRLYKDKNRLVVPGNIKVYLFVSLKNSLLRRLHTESKYDYNKPEIGNFLLEPIVEEQFIDNEQALYQQQKIKDVLAILTGRQKEIIYYRFIQELSFEEICELMGLNYQSAQNLIQRSLKKIRDNFKKESFE
ncbi:RNA polymerase sigma factor YlaC [termite gut metagenome]|uniref:RNA polymerase sigma factor YlaC n=1 Tax=termite gut metagenome TaxID=433724 RepID=A0A5J4Q660_9ZZZZ